MRITTFDINPQAPDYSNPTSIAALFGLARGNKSLQTYCKPYALNWRYQPTGKTYETMPLPTHEYKVPHALNWRYANRCSIDYTWILAATVEGMRLEFSRVQHRGCISLNLSNLEFTW
ncbi:MAG: hypothetical protein KME15_26130 [Drouetiella hepatica Uher 2000/2452]|uniref:Uncharacterized protein n=1 Tax=Drouetiella hepatica Uher 2000/2452 TaxID=904376 RepID=A0A951QJ19_9CYAN|nr:hypothetical protein [Drouetiella hepatica Uher 2000/2452]